jgi:hypothetical protein
MTETGKNDARINQQVALKVEEGLRLSHRQGIHPAIIYMEQAGVPRVVVLRVLCSPKFLRQRDRRRTPRPGRQHTQVELRSLG